MTDILNTGVGPRYISFNGVDENTSLEDLQLLAKGYRTQFGLLLAPDTKGRNRYPSLAFIKELTEQAYRQNQLYEESEYEIGHPIHLSLHLCGEYIDQFIEDEYLGFEQSLKFAAVQFNVADRNWSTQELASFIKLVKVWSTYYGFAPIIQTSTLTEDDSIVYLLDNSRGKGVPLTELKFPENYFPPGRNRRSDLGIAGGINRDNVQEIIRVIDNSYRAATSSRIMYTNYFLDLESGARDQGDNFNPELCLDICRNAFGYTYFEADDLDVEEDTDDN